MLRIFAYSRTNAPICEIQESQVVSAKLHEEINGEHSLTLVTTQKLDKGCRLVFKTVGRRGVEKWHEYAVAGIDSDHHIGNVVLYTYYCVWSLQEDLQGIIVSAMPGVQSPVTALWGLAAVLSSQTRWNIGTVSISTKGGASMYDRSAWDALSVLAENWDCEIDVRIVVNSTTGVVTFRYVDISSHLGDEDAVYRFDFGANISSITRKVDDTPYYCRVTPRGKGEQTEGGGYGRKITIASVNGGDDYLTYSGMLNEALLKNPDGTTLYPTLKIENSKCETPEELLAWAQGVIADYCTPKVSYTVDAYRAVREDGTDDGYLDLQLGDNVYVVDEGFEGGLRFESRIVAMDRDLLDERNNVVQISNAQQSISTKFASLGGSGGTSYSQPSVSSAIGGVEPKSTSGINAASGTNTDIVSLSLPAGIWMLCGQVAFPVNATGRRAAKISTVSGDSANVISTVVQDAVTGALTRCSTSRCLSLASQTTVYLIGYQNSGETLSCSGQFEATKIG